MRSCGIVVSTVRFHELSKLRRVDHQQFIQTFLAYRPDPAFRKGVGSWHLKGSENHVKAFGLDDGIERLGKLRLPVMTEKAQRWLSRLKVPDQVPRWLGHPG